MPDSAVSNDVERLLILHMLQAPQEWCVMRCLRKELLGAIAPDKVEITVLERVLETLTDAGLLDREWGKCDTEYCPPQYGWKLSEAGIRAALHIARSGPQRALEPA